jgi:hypothetical protein
MLLSWELADQSQTLLTLRTILHQLSFVSLFMFLKANSGIGNVSHSLTIE